MIATRQRSATTAVAAVVLALLAGACERSPDTAEGSIRALALRVRLELLQKLGVDGARVEVEAVGGTVRLAGSVRKRATAELAEEVARQVEGVVAVRNEIEVVESPVGGDRVQSLVAEAERELADAALETRVRLALVDRLGSDGFRIGTDAADGVVTLEFPAGIERTRRRDAARTARQVEGARRVITLVRK